MPYFCSFKTDFLILLQFSGTLHAPISLTKKLQTMKKLLLTLVLVISSLTAGAQVYLGGEVGL